MEAGEKEVWLGWKGVFVERELAPFNPLSPSVSGARSEPAVGRGRPDGRRATKDELATLQVPLPLSLAASQQLLVCRIRDSEPVPSIVAVSVPRPAQPTDNRSCSLSFQIIPRFSARIDSQVPSRPLWLVHRLAFLIARSILFPNDRVEV